jgi:hypothetical protein
VIERKLDTQIPKSIKLDIVYDSNGDIDIDSMVGELDDKLKRISEKFNINY